MPLFKKKPQSLIPPVEAPVPRQSNMSSRSSSTTYVASRDAEVRSNDILVNAYNKNSGPGDVYSRGTAELNKDRNELFSGYNPTKSGSSRFFDGPDVKDLAEGEDDVEGIKQQTRFVKQEGVNSTRNALRLAREAEETGRNTLSQLGQQSEKLGNTERHLDMSAGNSRRAKDNADEIKKLNQSIFRPAITFNKEGKRAAQEERLRAMFDEERMNREKVVMEEYRSRGHIGEARGTGEAKLDGLGMRSADPARKEQRKRFQFEANASDDELEDELDDNLDEISKITNSLKVLGTAMGNELEHQNGWINDITRKTDGLDQNLQINTDRLKRIK